MTFTDRRGDATPFRPEPVNREGGEHLNLLALAEPEARPKDPTLRRMLDSGNEREKKVAQEIQQLMSSEDEEIRKDGQKLLAMLKNRDTAAVAMAIVQRFPESKDVHKAIELVSDTTMPASARKVSEWLKSTNEGERGAAENLVRMSSDEDPAVRKDAALMRRWLNTPAWQADTQILLHRFDGNNAGLHEAIQLTTDKSRKDVAAVVMSLLQKDDTAQEGVRLTSMLMSTDKTESADAQQLARMLADKQKRDDALTLMRAFAFEPHTLHETLALLNDANRRSAATEVMALLKNHDTGEAGKHLAAMLSSNDQAVRTDGEELLQMLANRDQRGLALNILARLPKDDHVHEMLRLLKQPENKATADELVQMLKDDAGAENAAKVLDLRKSKVAGEGDADSMLRLLGSSDKSLQEDARRAAALVNDAERLHKIIQMLGNAELRPQVRQLLNMLESQKPAEQKAGQALLNLLTGNETDTALGARMLKLAGLDQNGMQAVQTVLERLPSKDEQKFLLDLLAQPATAAEAKDLLAELRDTKTRAGARAMIGLLQRSDGNDFGKNLLAMLSDPHQRRLALKLAERIDDAGQLATLFQLRDDKTTNAGANKLISMISGGNESDIRAAKELLKHFGPERGPEDPLRRAAGFMRDAEGGDKETGRRLLAALVDPRQEQLAMRVLTNFSAGDHRHVLDFLTGVRYKASAPKLLEMLNDPRQSIYAKQIVSVFRNPSEIAKMVELFNDPNNKEAAFNISYLMSNAPDAARELGFLLTSNLEDSRAQGQELVKMLNGDATSVQTAFNLLQSRLQFTERKSLSELFSKPETNAIAEDFASLLQSDRRGDSIGIQTLLEMMQSKDAASKATASYIMEMLKRPDERELAMTILTTFRSPQQLTRVVDALRDPRERPALNELMQHLTNDEAKASARRLLEMLNGRNPEEKQAGTKIFSLLGGTADQRQYAHNILGRLESPDEITRFMNLTAREGVASKKLSELMASKDQDAQRAIVNFMRLTSSNPEQVARVLAALEDKNKQSDMLALLSGVQSGRQLATVLKLGASKEYESGVKTLVDMLKTGDREKQDAVRAFIALLPDAPREGSGTRVSEGTKALRVLQALGKPETRDFVTRSIHAAGTQDGMRTMIDLLQSSEGQRTAQQLIEMSKDPSRKDAARILIEKGSSERNIRTMLTLTLDPKREAGSGVLLEMLADQDELRNFKAQRVLRALSSDSQESREAGAAMLTLLSDPITRRRAESLLLMEQALQPATMRFVADKKFDIGSEALVEMSQSDDFEERRAASHLLTLLSSSDPQRRAKGERIMHMLNNPTHQHTGRRMLREDLAPPSGRDR